MSNKFKPGPYNYCDYRCEKCDNQQICRVYKEQEERNVRHYINNKDPNDIKIILSDLKEIFEKTKSLLQEDARKYGVNLDEMPLEDEPEKNPYDFPVYCIANEYYQKSKVLIKDVEKIGLPKSACEDFETLIWYHTLILAKTYRLISNTENADDEDLQQIEKQGTIAVINKGIMLSKAALKNLLNDLPDHLHTILELLQIIDRLETCLRVDFL